MWTQTESKGSPLRLPWLRYRRDAPISPGGRILLIKIRRWSARPRVSVKQMSTSITWGLRAWPRQDVRGSVQSLCLSEIALILVHFSEFSWNSLQKSWKIWILGCASYPNFSLFLQTISFKFWKEYSDIVQFHIESAIFFSELGLHIIYCFTQRVKSI